jgi:outer membrane protein TolC
MVLEAKRSSIEMYRRKSIDKATQEIQSIVLHLDGLMEQIAMQNDVVTLAEEALRLENIRYTKGGSDLLDLFKRESNLLKAQQTLVKLKADVQIQMALIWAATGVFPNTITRLE